MSRAAWLDGSGERSRHPRRERSRTRNRARSAWDLRRGDDFEKDAIRRGSLTFYVNDSAGNQVAALRLYPSSYAGGGWFDDKKEVLEIRCGVIQLLIATVDGFDPGAQ